MGQPTWRKIKTVKVPEIYIHASPPEETITTWTPALDYVTAGKLYRIDVPGTGKWIPESGSECNADGDPTLTRSSSVVIDSSPVGALIAKIGGSTADLTPNKDKLILFSAGRHCVFSVSEPAKTGSLYLAVNDTPGSQSKVTGQLEVTIFESL